MDTKYFSEKLISHLLEDNREDFVNEFFSQISYKNGKLGRMQAYGVYKMRSKLHENKPKLYAQFIDLLSALEFHKEDDVMIHSIIIKNKLWLTFSSLDCSLFLGTLVFEGEDSKE